METFNSLSTMRLHRDLNRHPRVTVPLGACEEHRADRSTGNLVLVVQIPAPCGPTGSTTQRSAAIAALGARLDGALRHHQARRDGTVRDSVVFSSLSSEWPDAKRNVAARLARHEVRKE